MADLYNQKRLEELARKYLRGTITAGEQQEFDQWFADDTMESSPVNIELEEITHREALLARIHADANIVKTRTLWPRIAAAASILIALSVGGYFLSHKAITGQQTAQIEKQDFLPGGNKAILTLSNGEQIVLNNAKNGKLTSQGNMIVNKTQDGEVVYQTTGQQNNTTELAYNTYSTPKGGQYQVVLPDGSHVWLNDASSIKFPVNFASNERLVSITGEVYFEVAHDKTKPFRVKSEGQTVEVLGTHFNVNAYADEPVVKTTLLEGSVRVTSATDKATLKPGQQSDIVIRKNAIHIEKNVDLEKEVAWVKGNFKLDGADIQTIMRQAARWYDVEVEYQGEMPTRKLSGTIKRSVNASKFLEALSFFNVHFQIQGKKIIVRS